MKGQRIRSLDDEPEDELALAFPEPLQLVRIGRQMGACQDAVHLVPELGTRHRLHENCSRAADLGIREACGYVSVPGEDYHRDLGRFFRAVPEKVPIR